MLVSSFMACKKETNQFFPNGSAPVLKSSATSITPGPADSSNTVLSLQWSNPKYSTDSSNQKFVVEIDSTGRNFSHEMTYVIKGPLTFSLTGSQLNNILANFGFTPGKATSVDFRVTSSYSNNNEQYKSNIVTVTVTPYLVPIKLTASATFG